MTEIFFLLGVFVIAVLYSGVGHGGASGYLAFMSLLNVLPDTMRPAALILNVFVSAIASYAFYRNKHLKLNLLWPFIITSIPAAFIGGTIHINAELYKIILGVFLLIAIARMLFQTKEKSTRDVKIGLALFIGAVLGFFSGLIGIGGGIILSPVIILLGWGNYKETAAVSALFILVNSLAGLAGFMTEHTIDDSFIIYLVIFGVAGGIVGSYLGSYRLNEKYMRYTLAFVLVVASIKLIFL